MLSEDEKKVLDVTFNSTPDKPDNFNGAWGWRIGRNPNRLPEQRLTDEERDVYTLEAAKDSQSPDIFTVKTYSYCSPFNYPNIKVELGRPGTGIEHNCDGSELDIYPYGAITIEHEQPIVGITVIGSGCSGLGYIIIEAEPVVWKYPRTGVRMMRTGLWGVHIRGDALDKGIREDWNDAGLSSARFDLPECRKVIVGGGSHGADPHYCVRIIRLDVKEPGS